MSYVTVICMSILLACFFVFVVSILQTSERTGLEEQARLIREQEEKWKQKHLLKQQKRQQRKMKWFQKQQQIKERKEKGL